MKKFICILVCILAMNGMARSQSWTQKSPTYNYGRRSASGCTMNGKGYTGLGVTCDNIFVKDFWEYDTVSNGWLQLADYPGNGSADYISFAIKGKIYVGLGLNGPQVCQFDLWEYNRTTNTWTRKRDFPSTARYGSGCFVIGDSAFVVAGSHYQGNDYLYDMWMYNPATDTWKQKADFPGGKRAWGTSFSIGGMGYFGLGFSSTYTQETDFWKYNPVTNTWSGLAGFPGAPRAANCFVADNTAYVCFGTDNTQYFHDVWGYHPATNSWNLINVPLDLPERTACFTFSFSDKAFIGNGRNAVGVLADLWEFNPGIPFGIVNRDQPESFRVYPNPATDKVILDLPASADLNQTETDIYNAQGKMLLQKPLLKKRTELDLGDLPDGIYFVKVRSGESNMTAKFIKE
ncbi:MAG: T9SS type A sorting domain-containing protein [Bacteroidetes bacterium]|nr:T9SS type A sorting domain-containing protein [Bacteroidota bacterium]